MGQAAVRPDAVGQSNAAIATDVVPAEVQRLQRAVGLQRRPKADLW